MAIVQSGELIRTDRVRGALVMVHKTVVLEVTQLVQTIVLIVDTTFVALTVTYVDLKVRFFL